MKLRDLPGLGPKSEQELIKVGIHTPAQLADIGAVAAFARLTEQSEIKPSLNFLYAMVGALENRHWTDVASTERERLMTELAGYQEMQELLQEGSER